MRTLTTSKTSVAVLAGLTLAGALAGCSSPAADVGTQPTEPDTTETDTTDQGTDTGAGAYADGTYSATGDYQAPSGTETIEVTLTLSGDVITAVEVVGEATDPQAKIHQGEFIGGIGAIVVGKDIDSIQVDKVGGSSLTSGGFTKAVEEIKADAAA